MEKTWIKDGNFIELKADQMAGFTPEILAEYHKDFTKNMIDNSLKSANENVKKELETIKSDIEKMKIEEMQANFKGLQDSIRAISGKQVEVKSTFESEILKNKDFFSNPENYRQNKSIVLKGFETKATATTASIATNYIYRDIPGIGQIPVGRPTFTDYFTVIDIPGESNRYAYTDWDSGSIARAAAAIDEGGVFPESTAAFKGYTIELEKVGDTMKVTDEMMRFYPTFMQEIRNFVNINVEQKINTDLYTGNGTSPNINGIYTVATTFNHGAWSGAKAKDPSLVDLINCVSVTMTNGKDSKYIPNVAFVNPSDYLSLLLKQDANGMPMYNAIIQNLSIQIVPSSFVTANTMVVADGRFIKVLRGSEYIIELGYSTGDFEYDLYTLKAKRYLNLLVRHADRTGVYKVTDITAALAAIKV